MTGTDTEPRPGRRQVAGFVAAGLVVTVLVAFGLSRWASPEPDGLERVAADHALDTEVEPRTPDASPFADYSTAAGSTTGERARAWRVWWEWPRCSPRPPASQPSRADAGTDRPEPTRADPSRPIEPAVMEPRDFPVTDGAQAAVHLVCLVGFLLAVVLVPARTPWTVAAHVTILATVATLTRLPPGRLARNLAVTVPFLAFAALLPFTGPGPQTSLGGLSASEPGLWGAWSIATKALLGTAAAAVLAWTTSPEALLVGLDRLHLPRRLTVIGGFMVRYLAVVTAELRRLQIARVSRADDPRWLGQGHALGATAGTLFIRTYERGEACSRPWWPEGSPAPSPPPPASTRRLAGFRPWPLRSPPGRSRRWPGG